MVQKIQNTKPLMAFDENADYYEWKTQAKQKLEELLGLPFEKCNDDFRIQCESDEEGYHKIDFEFQSEEGYYIPCNLLIPNQASQPLPTVICCVIKQAYRKLGCEEQCQMVEGDGGHQFYPMDVWPLVKKEIVK